MLGVREYHRGGVAEELASRRLHDAVFVPDGSGRHRLSFSRLPLVVRDAEQSALELGVRLDARVMLELGNLRLGSDVLGLNALQRQHIALVLEFTAQGVVRNGIFNLPVELRLLRLMPGHSRVLLLHLY